MAASAIANLFSSSIFFPSSSSSSKPPQLPSTTNNTAVPSSNRPFDSLPTLSSSSSRTISGKNDDPLLARPDNDVLSVVCPSLAYANTLFFRSAYNVQVIVDDNEPEEKLLNRFRREVMKAGVIQECRRRRFHENKQDEKKRKTREAAKRNRRRRPQSRNSFQDKQDAVKNKKDDDDQDNWDLPEGDLPY
ncbi:OLC1v1011822C1 [Oldenlandia corymbosa var. corymbosa]|uniref:OLC1v1011822C1 n=1 Tax=Oldenlandia corymbosa var. corymbosa TaxID=529605 RepID=A0AAV1DWS8_OLDCO|nr:OLC1v1011822C1 [Oldenlandia corymbosa var. corymbosa]